MSGWTTLPPWLYQNDLPDEELQARYVRRWEQTWAECVADRQALEQELGDLQALQREEVTAEMWAALRDEIGERTDWLRESRRVEAEAKQRLDDARAALARYRGTPPLPPPRRRLRGG